VSDTSATQWMSQREVEQAALEEVKRRLEAGELPARPGRLTVTVCEEVQG
jgi:hypothetical protein